MKDVCVCACVRVHLRVRARASIDFSVVLNLNLFGRSTVCPVDGLLTTTVTSSEIILFTSSILLQK